MSQKTLWIINQYASTPQTGLGGRHYYLARELAKQGYKVYLIGASYSHILRNSPPIGQKFEMEQVEGFYFVRVKVPKYKNSHSKKRIWNWFLFAHRIKSLANIIPDAPQAILYSSPSLIGFSGASYLARKFKALLAFEVRDIWPLTFQEIGGYSPKHPFVRLLQRYEDMAYRSSDCVISNLKYSVDHMVTRGMERKKFHWVPNGISLDEVSHPEPLSSDTEALFPKDKFIVGYTGSIGLANALEAFIEAADLLKNETKIAFVLIGFGAEKDRLVELANKKQLANIIFIDPIPKRQIQSALHKFDVCFLSVNKSRLYRYGVALNKLYDYLFSEKPIIYAIDSGEYRPIYDAKAGIEVAPQNPGQIAEAILELSRMPLSERQQMGKNGRQYVEALHDYSKLADKLAQILFKK